MLKIKNPAAKKTTTDRIPKLITDRHGPFDPLHFFWNSQK